MTGPLPRLPERRLSIIRPGYEAIPVGSSGGGASTSGSRLRMTHASASVPVPGMPETRVGTPAVIAWTSSCCVVSLRR